MSLLWLVASCVGIIHPKVPNAAARELASAEPLFPAIFTFGDSLLDAGNNNYLATAMAKANMLPNGIDFPTHNATGRFCNGKILVDLIGEQPLPQSRAGLGAHWPSCSVFLLEYTVIQYVVKRSLLSCQESAEEESVSTINKNRTLSA